VLYLAAFSVSGGTVSNDAVMNRIGLEGYGSGIILSNVPERTEKDSKFLIQ
jgi:hypothetical protein